MMHGTMNVQLLETQGRLKTFLNIMQK